MQRVYGKSGFCQKIFTSCVLLLFISKQLGKSPFPEKELSILEKYFTFYSFFLQSAALYHLPKITMDTEETKDAHGTVLADGDQVFLIKDLTIKGSKNTIKQGTVYKIRLTDNVEEVDCPGGLVLKTCFIKKKK